MKTNKETPLLDFYKKVLDNGNDFSNFQDNPRINGGLCSVTLVENNKNFELFEPKPEEGDPLGEYVGTAGHWGYDGGDDYQSAHDLLYVLSPMRQTIVLFLAAMDGELD